MSGGVGVPKRVNGRPKTGGGWKEVGGQQKVRS